ncbi:MAG: N-acetylmannosamine-6-phosphate 2-epimerase [Candidatus Obscuribacter sp.]|nr:N-acetylmannosamine-6-phosphate 2-epimerase [Candidatus Obscuribacter sp.]
MVRINESYSHLFDALSGNLIVSCQASKGEPLCKPEHILALSLSALNGGARALRLEGVENIAFVRQAVDALYKVHLPIVGLTKADIAEDQKLTTSYITATFADARALADAGADIIALDATGRRRLDDMTLAETIERIHRDLHKPVWADCATFAEGEAAAACGADIVSTTLFGYTAETALPPEHGPGLELLRQFVDRLDVPVILEGRVWHPEEITEAFTIGAFAVVVGSAITRPQLITERFVKAIPAHLKTKNAGALGSASKANSK